MLLQAHCFNACSLYSSPAPKRIRVFLCRRHCHTWQGFLLRAGKSLTDLMQMSQPEPLFRGGKSLCLGDDARMLSAGQTRLEAQVLQRAVEFASASLVV